VPGCPTGYSCTPTSVTSASAAVSNGFSTGSAGFNSLPQATPTSAAQNVGSTFSNGYYYSSGTGYSYPTSNYVYPSAYSYASTAGMRLSATCTGTAFDYGKPNGIIATWTADPTGGTAPYSYQWTLSTDALVAQTMTKNVYASYSSGGAKQAMVRVVDASGNSATASCSVNIAAASAAAALPTASAQQQPLYPSVSASPPTVRSGGTVTLNLVRPAASSAAKIYVSCPAGVTISLANGANACNLLVDTGAGQTLALRAVNMTGSNQVLTSNYYVYTADRPNVASGVAATFTVTP
jgi:hypothetical protein